MRAIIDIETRSACDLRKCGAYVYADHPTTQITHIAYKVGGAPTTLWRPLDGSTCPDDLMALLADTSATLVAHNFEFERSLMSGPAGAILGLPVGALKDFERWDCTAARAAAICLPRALASAAKALRLPIEKDAEGHKLMLQCCKPRRPRKDEDPSVVYWWEDEARLARMDAYCIRDVDTEYELDKVLPPLRPEERETWLLTSRMNGRGVLVDRALVDAVLTMTAKAEEEINATLRERTGGAVPAVSDNGALTRWLVAQGVDDADDTGVGKAALAAMLDSPELDPLVRDVLCIRRDGGGSSSKKWKAILARTSADGRLRGSLVYCGASSTGRWSSTGAQLQNLPSRVSLKDTAGALRDVMAGADPQVIGIIHGPPLIVASALLRPAFMAAPGALIARGDYSQIEARVNPWLAGAAWKLDAFRAYDAGTGPDLYKVAAAGIFRCTHGEVTKDQRQTGKVAELALGFGGGAGALQNMAAGVAYGVELPRHPRDASGMPEKGEPAAGTDEWIKRMWRKANREVVGFWLGLETAAIECMRRPPGDVVEVWTLRADWADGERVTTRMHKTPVVFTRNRMALAMRLPSGRSLLYWWPELRQTKTPYGDRLTVFYHAEDAMTKQWKAWNAWGGILCENAVQAVARDIMRDALLRLYSLGILSVLTVHDEGIAEVMATDPDAAARLVEDAMLVPCEWAPGLPIAADSSAGPRYVKG